MYTISQIEDAIIARIESQMTYLRTCESLSLDLLDEISEITIRLPAAYVIYASGRYLHMTGAQDREMEFLVVVAAKNLRGDVAARHGKGSEIGVYKMLDDTRGALTKQACGLDIDSLLPGDEEIIFGAKDMAGYGIRFTTRCRYML